MDRLVCAICIQAIYSKYALQHHDAWGTPCDPVFNLRDVQHHVDNGHHFFEPGQGLAIGFYADTIIKGIAICATHALYVVNKLDLLKI